MVHALLWLSGWMTGSWRENKSGSPYCLPLPAVVLGALHGCWHMGLDSACNDSLRGLSTACFIYDIFLFNGKWLGHIQQGLGLREHFSRGS